MGLNLEYLAGQTPLEEEEKEGLRILSVSSKAELDEFEQKNIEQRNTMVYRKKNKNG